MPALVAMSTFQMTGFDLLLIAVGAAAIACPILLHLQVGGGFRGRNRRWLFVMAVAILILAPVFGPLFASMTLLTTDTRARWFGGLVVVSVVLSTALVFTPVPAALVLAGLSVCMIAAACLAARHQSVSPVG